MEKCASCKKYGNCSILIELGETEKRLLLGVEIKQCGHYQSNNPPFHRGHWRYEMLDNKTNKELIDAWDRGESVWSIEMGGLGPGYEQCIQICIFELVRDMQDKPLPTEETWRDWGRETITRLDKDLGFSGAQVGVAKSIAHVILKDGYQATIDKAHIEIPDRLIQVSKNYPRISDAPTPSASLKGGASASVNDTE